MARVQAEEAKGILEALDVEGDIVEEGEEDEVLKATAKRTQEEKKLSLKVSALIRLGRHSLLDGGEEDALMNLPSFRALKNSAKAERRTLSIGCFSPVEDSVALIRSALELTPTPVATEVPLNDEEPVEPATTMDEEEQLGSRLEEAATAAGIELSHCWKRFCPVTALEQSVLAEGAMCYSCVFEGRLYLTASAKKKQQFMLNPHLYISQKPLDRRPVLLLAEPEALSATRPEKLLESVADTMDLTVLTLPQLHSAVLEWSQLRDSRSTVYHSREEFELNERKARQERGEKRRKQEAKQKKKNKEKQSAVTFGEEPPATDRSETEARRPPPKKRTLTQDVLQEKIDALTEERKVHLPVLVSTLDGVDADLLDLLIREDLLPHQVVVLEKRAVIVDRKEDEEAEEAPEKNTDSPLADILRLLENPPNSVKEGFKIQHINITDKTTTDIINEIDHSFNPAAPTVEDGAVDEELGQEEEEEDEEDLDDEEEGEETRRPPPRPVNPLLKPRKKFDHQFGALLQYCPVTYKLKGILVRGQVDCCVSYLDKLYLFASEENKELFRQNPLYYLNDINIRRTPPRVWMVGPTYSGKKTLANTLKDEYDVTVFTYDRTFFENCIEAARSTDGAYVGDIFIKPQPHDNYYLKRANDIWSEVRRIEAEEREKLKLRDEAIKKLEELEAKREEEDYEEEEGAEEEEERLRELSEFEPEDEEEKQIRLSESYLRIASCVVRIEPFETRGYIMICPPFSEGDVDILFSEGGIPEVVVRMSITKEEFCRRGEIIFEEQKKARTNLLRTVEKEQLKKLEVLRQKQLKRERKLKKWRRRNIGKDDEDAEEEEDSAETQKNKADGDAEEDTLVAPDLPGTATLQLEAVEEFIASVEERLVKVVNISADLAPGAVAHSAITHLDRHLASRISLLFIPEVITFDKAELLLDSGAVLLSYFNKEDPVELYERRHGKRRVCKWKPDGFRVSEEPVEETGEDTAQGEEDEQQDDEVSEYADDDLEEMRQRHEKRKRRELNATARRTALLGPFLFYFDNDESLLAFLKNPILYLEQAAPSPVLLTPPLCAVYEDSVFADGKDPSVKKRGLAESIAYNVDAVFISAGKLLSWAVRQPSLGVLHQRALDNCVNGTAADALLANLLRVRLSSADVKRRGAVLVNLPRTKEQFEAIQTPSCLPLCKVATVLENSDALPFLEELKKTIEAYANVRWEAPFPTQYAHPANISSLVHQLDVFTDQQRENQIRQPHAFAANLHHLYCTRTDIDANLSEYQHFCPYRWVEEGDIVRTEMDPIQFGAMYLGKYYFFSSKEFLSRFLDDPTEVADPQNLRPLPPLLPEVVNESVPLSKLEHQGCCPVVLYDTRDRRGLRGVIEPIAQKGSMDHLVRYDGKIYALLDDANMARFITCPWQFVEGASMPEYHKRPLDEGRNVSDVKDEEYIRRYLYDALSKAMKDVADIRPIYPDLTPEESALKYIALHMKAHNTSENNDIQSAQYAENFETFRTRSQLYQKSRKRSLQDSEEEKALFDQLCTEYEKLQYGVKSLHTLSQLSANGHNNI